MQLSQLAETREPNDIAIAKEAERYATAMKTLLRQVAEAPPQVKAQLIEAMSEWTDTHIDFLNVHKFF